MSRFRGIPVVAMLSIALLAPAARADIDPFYLELERDGEAAADRGEWATAARLYRIACFGMLDEPARLAACTARLALAQAAIGDREAFAESFSRLALVEERFQGLTLAALTPDERQLLARRAAALLPPAVVAGIPSVAALAKTEKTEKTEKAGKAEKTEKAPATPPPEPARESLRAREAARDRSSAEVLTSPALVEDEAPATDESGGPAADGDGVAPDREGSEPDALPALTAVPARLPPDEEERIAAARELVRGQPELAALQAALVDVLAVAARHPEQPGLLRLAGDIAYRAADWTACAEAYLGAGDPGPDAPLERFYMAVCLYETGRREEAATLLSASADRLRRTPFVDGYLVKILGSKEIP